MLQRTLMLLSCSQVLQRTSRVRATTEKQSICLQIITSLSLMLLLQIQTQSLFLQAVLLFLCHGFQRLRVSLIQVLADRQQAQPLQIFLQVRLTHRVKHQKLILFRLNQIRHSVTIRAVLLLQSIRKAFTSVTDIMIRQMRMLCSHSASVFHIQHLSTAILNFPLIQSKIQTLLQYHSRLRTQAK